MSRVVTLASSGRSVVAKFHELRLKYWNRDLDVVCCFEGNDDIEFYLPRVRDELGLHSERIDFVNCSGKSAVLLLSQWVRQRGWNLARIGFFVDRDLEDFISANLVGDQIYVSDYYSIESHVFDAGFFDNVWQSLFHLSISDARRQIWKSAYYRGAEDFARHMRSIAYVAIAYKRVGGVVDFDRVKLADFVLVSGSGAVTRLSARRNQNYSTVFVGSKPSLSEIRAARNDVARVDMRHWLRGKFAIWFAMQFFSRMKAVLGSKSEPNRAVVKASFGVETAITCLCGQLVVPRSLVFFLRSWAALIVRDGLVPSGATA